MALETDYTAGTITLTNGDTAFTGTGTGWLAGDYRNGDVLIDIVGGDGRIVVIEAITGNTTGELSIPWEGPDLTDVEYRMRVFNAGDRLTGQVRNMVDLLGNGNLQSLAAVTGPGVMVMDGPHSVTVKPETDFINGVAYNVQVDALADRDAYDGQSVGFAVLVSDIGDGRSAVYSKASNTVADWTDPAFVTGPIGLSPEIEATITTLPVGGTADVIRTDITGGYSFEFRIPAAPGFYWESLYNAALSYAKDSVVRRNGSSFIAVQNVPPGTQPSGATPPVDTAYWEVLAIKGNDGLGTVTALNEGDGIDIDATDPTMPIVSVNGTETTALLDAFTGDAGSGGLQGAVPAPAAGDAAKFLRGDGGWAVIPPPDTLSVSVLALQVADNTNLPVFGMNWWADAFDTLGLVDVAGATNLDTSAPGILKPTSSYSPATFLTHMDGSNGSSSFVDVAGGTVISSTGTVVDTSQSKFGGASAAFTGTSYLLLDGTSGFTFGTGDFTIDFWIRPLVTTGMYIYDQRNTGSQIVPLIRTNGSSFLEYFVNGSVRITGTDPVTTGAWHHVALSRVSGNTRMFLNGVQQGTTWPDASNYIAVANRPAIGTVGDALGNSAGFNGYMDELRICKGAGLWSANFTPPASALSPASSNLTVRSSAADASFVPDIIEAILPIKEVDAATPGTDYTVEFSRDNRTTWIAATITELFASPSPVAGIIFVRAVADVSAQPSGTKIAWRLKTLTNKMIEFHGAKTDWNA